MQLLKILILAIILQGCTATSTDVQTANLGQNSSLENLLQSLNEPGTIIFEKHLAANWKVPLSGLLNLEHEKSRNAGLVDKDEPIQIYVYTLRHPKFGTFFVDSGVSKRFSKADNPDVSMLMKHVMNTDALNVVLTTESLVKQYGTVSGVFLTHLHFDHVMGLTDINKDVPIYIGMGDASFPSITHLATQGTINRLLANVDHLKELQFNETNFVDIFGDGSLWAIHSPGHTVGTTAYLARTTNGPQLMIGDVTHTRWGWDNGVEPGSYSNNTSQNAASLAKLRKLKQTVPSIIVHPGHQE